MLLTHVGKSQPGRRRILGLAAGGRGECESCPQACTGLPGGGGLFPADAATCSLASVSPSVKGRPWDTLG